MIGIPARQNLHCTFKHSVFGSKMQQLEDRNAMKALDVANMFVQRHGKAQITNLKLNKLV